MCVCVSCLVLDLTSSWSSNSHHFDSSATIVHYQLYLCVHIPLAKVMGFGMDTSGP